MNELINKIKKDCLEVHREDENYYSLVVSKKNANKVINELKAGGVELHLNYGVDILIDVIL